MNEHNEFKEEALHLIREVEKDPALNQRFLSQRLNISLGKTNYLLKELIKKGVIKVVSFTTNPGKANRMGYFLTKKGLQRKALLIHHFLKVKEREYKRLRDEYENYLGKAKEDNTANKIKL